jgi:hypothetical protein
MFASGIVLFISMMLFRILPVALLVVGGYFLLKRSALGRAFLARQHYGTAELQGIVDECANLRRELDEVYERLDFTERMLTQLRSDRLGQGELQGSREPTPPKALTPV